MTRCVALTGGVGGAKLALGLSHVLAPDELLIVANTGDDFEHLGLTICPDIDTVLYTLASIVNPETGWGRAEESWRVLEALDTVGGDSWFRLGDKDIALHLTRAQRLATGHTLSEITAELSQQFGVRHRILPMSDRPVRTMVTTDQGELPFQEYFVKNRCEPRVSGFRFEGIETAKPHPNLLKALKDPALEAVVICPSNPFISIDPILGLPGLKSSLEDCPAPVIAVSPIVGGKALKGPASKMLHELDQKSDATAIAEHYDDLLDGFVIDREDRELEDELSTDTRRVCVTQTVMRSLEDRIALARDVLEFGAAIRASR
ncbi:MAG TPA: 2-phospho-L-lactate transferase [Rhodospirillaceae bacterium]|nr:2-phospho-L-lactate transferase [Rhodospirillaceae bacterium]HAA93210.1 2-phospho-L-lactate transferase [Rhodospirillaceae bacterium]HAT36632.1 2-phospho-L-lactate transferase [Rhodospirillaceae bacterium]